MATYLNVKRTQRFVEVIKAINTRLQNMSTQITSLQDNYDGLSAEDKAEVTAVLVEQGYTLADINAFYTEIKSVKTFIDANITNMVEPNF